MQRHGEKIKKLVMKIGGRNRELAENQQSDFLKGAFIAVNT